MSDEQKTMGPGPAFPNLYTNRERASSSSTSTSSCNIHVMFERLNKAVMGGRSLLVAQQLAAIHESIAPNSIDAAICRMRIYPILEHTKDGQRVRESECDLDSERLVESEQSLNPFVDCFIVGNVDQLDVLIDLARHFLDCYEDASPSSSYSNLSAIPTSSEGAKMDREFYSDIKSLCACLVRLDEIINNQKDQKRRSDSLSQLMELFEYVRRQLWKIDKYFNQPLPHRLLPAASSSSKSNPVVDQSINLLVECWPRGGPLDLIPTEYRLLCARDRELVELYSWVTLAYWEENETSRISSEVPIDALVRIMTSNVRPSDSTSGLWIKVMEYLWLHYGKEMCEASEPGLLVHYYCFFFTVLPDIRNNTGLKHMVPSCMLCLREVGKDGWQLADSHWIPEKLLSIVAQGDNQAPIRFAFKNEPTTIHGATLPLFCTRPTKTSTDVTCEQTRLDKGGETKGLIELEGALLGVRTQPGYRWVLSPQLHYLIASIAFREMLASCDDPMEQWFTPRNGPLPMPQQLPMRWAFFLELRKFCVDQVPHTAGQSCAMTQPTFSIHLFASKMALQPPAPKSPLLFGSDASYHRVTSSSHKFQLEQHFCYFYMYLHGFHFMVCWPPQTKFSLHADLQGRPAQVHVVLPSFTSKTFTFPNDPTHFELPSTLNELFQRTMILNSQAPQWMNGTLAPTTSSPLSSCLPTSGLYARLPNNIQYSGKDPRPCIPSTGQKRALLNRGELKFPDRTYERLWYGSSKDGPSKQWISEMFIETGHLLQHLHQSNTFVFIYEAMRWVVSPDSEYYDRYVLGLQFQTTTMEAMLTSYDSLDSTVNSISDRYTHIINQYKICILPTTDWNGIPPMKTGNEKIPWTVLRLLPALIGSVQMAVVAGASKKVKLVPVKAVKSRS